MATNRLPSGGSTSRRSSEPRVLQHLVGDLPLQLSHRANLVTAILTVNVRIVVVVSGEPEAIASALAASQFNPHQKHALSALVPNVCFRTNPATSSLPLYGLPKYYQCERQLDLIPSAITNVRDGFDTIMHKGAISLG